MAYAKSETGCSASGSHESSQVPSGSQDGNEKLTFSQLLKEFRRVRPAFSIEWKSLLPIPAALLLTIIILIALPVEVRELSWVRATMIVMVLAAYLYGLWLLILPLRAFLDPAPELLRDLDRRYAQECRLWVFLQTVPEGQRRLLSLRLERYVHRLTRVNQLSQLTFVLSPLFAFLLERGSGGGLSSLERDPLLVGGTVLVVVLLGMMQLHRALLELESLQFSLTERLADV